MLAVLEGEPGVGVTTLPPGGCGDLSGRRRTGAFSVLAPAAVDASCGEAGSFSPTLRRARLQWAGFGCKLTSHPPSRQRWGPGWQLLLTRSTQAGCVLSLGSSRDICVDASRLPWGPGRCIPLIEPVASATGWCMLVLALSKLPRPWDLIGTEGCVCIYER